MTAYKKKNDPSLAKVPDAEEGDDGEEDGEEDDE